MISATWVCLPLVMVASEVTSEFSALVLLFDSSLWPVLLQLEELGGHRRVGDERAVVQAGAAIR